MTSEAQLNKPMQTNLFVVTLTATSVSPAKTKAHAPTIEFCHSLTFKRYDLKITILLNCTLISFLKFNYLKFAFPLVVHLLFYFFSLIGGFFHLEQLIKNHGHLRCWRFFIIQIVLITHQPTFQSAKLAPGAMHLKHL